MKSNAGTRSLLKEIRLHEAVGKSFYMESGLLVLED